MKKITLVVMVAGLGSRFGGLKQMTGVDDNGNFIIDYSCFDAMKAGISKIVFITKKENLDAMKETIGKRLLGKVAVQYAIQDIKDIPTKKHIDRQKPWGTVQAVLSAKPYIDGDFIVINADDFYGFDAYTKAVDFLNKNDSPYEYANIAFNFNNTKSSNGAVKRGILSIKNGKIYDIIESSIIEKDGKALCAPLDGSTPFTKDLDVSVSMNMFAFKNDVFNILEDYFKEFFNQSDEDLKEKEALLPVCLNEALKSNKITIYAENTTSKWIGMTYKEDLDLVKKEISNLVSSGNYPKNLWK